jgi:hypothetical protein
MSIFPATVLIPHVRLFITTQYWYLKIVQLIHVPNRKIFGGNGDLRMSVHLDNIKWVEVHYTDLLGRLRSISTGFTEGIVFGIDGSSIGVENVESSDLLVIGD